jgi:glycosyltransferase involved in cell wall biosynthesis
MQSQRASSWLPLGRRLVLPHGLPPAILASAMAQSPPGPEVMFASQAYRGLADLIALWRSHIVPQAPAARFRAYIAASDIQRYRDMAAAAPSITILPRVANADMPAVLRGARVLLAPGHRAETFCLAAAEAVAMGVPVVTYGIGALAERVDHGRTGFICRHRDDMAARILTLLADDALWWRMHAQGCASHAGADWPHIAGLWEQAFAAG